MGWPETLQVGLKEWAAVCEAMERGEQVVLLRKGGILEGRGGFQVQHRAFLLFPTYLHQDATMLKAAGRRGLELRTREPERIRLAAAGVVSDVVQLQSRGQMAAIDDEHVWTQPLIDMRFDYRPKNPLFLLLVRVYRLAEAVAMANTTAYAGCKSWVPLERVVGVQRAAAVLGDGEFEGRRKAILRRVEGANV